MGLPWRGGRRERDEEFIAYYQARADHLRRTAYLLCGDWHLAEDLTQTAFTKLYRSWQRIQRHDVVDQYARRVLLRAYLDERRRPWRREFATTPDSAALDTASTADADRDDRMVLWAALAGLSRRHRAVLILRFWLDLPVEQVADLLGCSAGTVKSQTSRGLARLREALGGALVELDGPTQGGHS